jgi:chemotaxis signal transduction protein
MTILASNTTTTSEVALAPKSPKQLSICVSGGFEFSLPTEFLAGVYQIPREQMADDLEIVDTPEGKMPVISAAKLFADELGFDIQPDAGERDLVAIQADGTTVALRVENISRPVTLPQNGWHTLPQIARPNDKQGIISAIAAINPAAVDPNEALSLVMNPLIALGIETEQAEATPIDLPKRVSGAIEPQRRGSGQLLAFVPENIPRQDLNFVFCLPLAAVAEVVTTTELFESPLNTEVFNGFVLWRNIPIPVVNLGACFGLEKTDGEKRAKNRSRRLVIARASGHKYIAFHTQTQMHSMNTPTSTPVEFPSVEGGPMLGSFKTEFGSMVIPDLDRILQGEF